LQHNPYSIALSGCQATSTALNIYGRNMNGRPSDVWCLHFKGHEHVVLGVNVLFIVESWISR